MPRVTFTTVTGFLGSGKTTLINAYLEHRRDEPVLVMVNELGDVSVDHALLAPGLIDPGLIDPGLTAQGLTAKSSGHTVVPLAGGCLCCAYRGELAGRLKAALYQGPSGFRPHRIIIETSGLASPARIERELMSDPDLAPQLRVGGIVTCLDVLAQPWSESTRSIALEQLAIADRIVLTKGDLAPSRLGAMSEFAARVNPTAALVEQRDYALSPELDDASLLRSGRWSKPFHHGGPTHPDIERLVVRPPAWPPGLACEHLARLCAAAGPHLLRAKGLITPGNGSGSFAVQAVGGLLYPPVALPEGARWDPVLVLIGHRGLKLAIDSVLDEWVL